MYTCVYVYTCVYIHMTPLPPPKEHVLLQLAGSLSPPPALPPCFETASMRFSPGVHVCVCACVFMYIYTYI